MIEEFKSDSVVLSRFTYLLLTFWILTGCEEKLNTESETGTEQSQIASITASDSPADSDASLDLPKFMSQAHVDQMNRKAATNEKIKELAANLDRDYLWVMEMRDEDDTYYWNMHFDREKGFYFSLGDLDKEPDLRQIGQYRDMIAALWQIQETGAMGDPKLRDVGNPEVLQVVMPIYLEGQSSLAVPADLPTLDSLSPPSATDSER